MDNLSKEDRKKNMKNIRSKGTKPERIVTSILRKKGIYFTQHVSKVPGRPDITFLRKRIAVFIDSDFWHRNPKKFQMPQTNVDYWVKKINNNVERDKKVNKELERQGWRVIRIWESDIYKNPDDCVNKILSLVNEQNTSS